jgi:hypothetical protein
MTNLSSYSLPQLAQILSALEGARRNPNSKTTAIRAIERAAAPLGLSALDVLAASSGLLDGRLDAAAWRAQLNDAPATTQAAAPDTTRAERVDAPDPQPDPEPTSAAASDPGDLGYRGDRAATVRRRGHP